MKSELYGCICKLSDWLDQADYRAYDPFDGLSSPWLRPLTLNNEFLRQVLQQGVRRFLLNLRPLIGIKKSRSTKGMGFLARGFLRLYKVTGDARWRAKAELALNWLIENQSLGYSGSCWGNHFDYQARGSFYLPKGVPTIVWTSLIAHAFLDGYDHLRNSDYLAIATSACEHILRDVKTYQEHQAVCISYTPIHFNQVHNANVLAGSLLARTYAYTGNEDFRCLAEKAFRYTARYQRPDSSWYYGENRILHWIDNFHTAYVLDSFKYYIDATGDNQFETNMMNGYRYWKNNFFLPDGTPRYYNHKTLPVDIQCCSQAIDTLVFFSDRDPESLPLAAKIAGWTIKNMQDHRGFFYYRRYGRRLVNKTPTLHWGQATILCAMASLYMLQSREGV